MRVDRLVKVSDLVCALQKGRLRILVTQADLGLNEAKQVRPNASFVNVSDAQVVIRATDPIENGVHQEKPPALARDNRNVN